MNELQAARLMAMNGLSTCAYPVLSGGVDLRSPTLRKLQRGEPFLHGPRPLGSMNARGTRAL
jgi:hypothetical protein